MVKVGRHVPRRCRTHGLLILGGLLLLTAGCASTSSSKPQAVAIDLADDTTSSLNQAQLQALVMGMADTFGGGTMQASLALEAHVMQPSDRVIAHGVKYLGVTAAMTIAAGPSPEAALIDLLVLARMQPVGVERRLSLPDVGPGLAEYAPQCISFLRTVEKLVWKDAERILTPEQQEKLRSVIDAWLAEHPKLIAVYYVRLSDFTDLRNPRHATVVKGLLADVGNATRAVDDVRLLGERALWLGSRMPLAVGFQVERTLYDIVAESEAQQLINDSLRFTDAAVGISADVHALPDTITEQREALVADLTELQELAINNLMERIGVQRQALMADLDSREEMARGLLKDLRETIDAANGLVKSIDVVVSRFDSEETEPGREPLDMADVRDAATQAAVVADEFTELLEVAQELLASPNWDHRADQIGAAWTRVEQGGRGWISLGFRQSLMVVGTAFVGLVLYRLIAVKLIKS